MKGRCPKCGATFWLDEAVDARWQGELQEMAAAFGEFWELVHEYTDCYRTSEFGEIRPKRRWQLMKQLTTLFQTGEFEFRGKKYKTTKQHIVNGMYETVNRNIWNMKKDHYLYAILLKNAERLSAEGLTAAEEKKREENRRSGDEGNRRGGEPGKVDFKGLIKNV
jgi:hypothetical protein